MDSSSIGSIVRYGAKYSPEEREGDRGRGC